MKKQISKPVFFAILAVVVIAIAWFGWNSMETPENRGLNEEAIFRAAEAKAKANGVDIRTLPNWGALYYKYHPEEKPPTASGQPGVSPSVPEAPPSAPGGMTPPTPQ